MSTIVETDIGPSDEDIKNQADVVAAQITSALIKAFKDRESRDPTPDEVEQLIEEVTEDRIMELLNANGESNSNLDKSALDDDKSEGAGDSEDEDIDYDADNKGSVNENDEENQSDLIYDSSKNHSFDIDISRDNTVDDGDAKRRRVEE